MSKRSLFFPIFLIAFMCSVASATISYSDGTITIDGETATVPEVDSAISDTYFSLSGTNATCNADILITPDAGFIIDGYNLTMNCSSECEFTILSRGDLVLQNGAVVQGTPDHYSAIRVIEDRVNFHFTDSSFVMTDSTIQYMGSNALGYGGVTFGDTISGDEGNPITIINSTLQHLEWAILEQLDYKTTDNSIFSNNYVYDVSSTQIGNAQLLLSRTNTTVSNNIFKDILCSCNVIWVTGGSDSVVTNNLLDNVDGQYLINCKHSHNAIVDGNTITNGSYASYAAIMGYNGYTSGGKLADYGDTIVNNTITDSTGLYAYSVQYPGLTTTTVTNNTVDGGFSYGLLLLGCNNTRITDSEFFGSIGTRIQYEYYVTYPSASYVKDVVINNCTFDGTGDGIQFYSNNAYRVIFLNCAIDGQIDYSSYENIDGAYINCYYTTPSFDMIDTEEHHDYKYANVLVTDQDSNPVESAVITSSGTMYDGDGNVQASFTTGSDGKPTEFIAVPDYLKTASGTTQLSSTLTASNKGDSQSIAVSPDSTWYSIDLCALSSPLLTFTIENDVLSSSPSSENVTSYYNVDQWFNISSDVIPDSVSWYLDDVLVQSSGLSYVNGDATANTHTVTVSIINGSSTYNNTWNWNLLPQEYIPHLEGVLDTYIQSEHIVQGFDFAGDFVDFSTYGNDGVGTNTAFIEDTEGDATQAVYFDGTASIDSGNDESLNLSDQLTIFARGVNLTSTSDSYISMRADGSTYRHYGLQIYPTGIKLFIWTGTGYEQPLFSYVPQIGTPTNYTATVNGTECRLYVDGEYVDNAPLISPMVGIPNAVQMLGNRPSGTFYLSGSMDEYLLYNIALSQDNIALLDSGNYGITSAILAITSVSPITDPTTTVGESLTISSNFSSICNVSILHNGTEVQSYSNVDNFSYSNSTASAGTFNVTMVANDGINEVSHTWTWTVESSSTGFTNPSFTQAVGGFTATVIAFAGLFFINRRRN